MKYIFLYFSSFASLCNATENMKIDSCLFSEDGQNALILESSYPSTEKNNSIKYGLYHFGKNEKKNFVQYKNDTIFYLKNDTFFFNDEFDSITNKEDFINKYKLFLKGIDITSKFTINIDSSFVRRGLPYLENGELDTFCLPSNFYNFYITYSYYGKIIYFDTLYSSNTTTTDLINLFNQQEKTPMYSEKGEFMGTIGYGTKIYTDKDFKYTFFRTKYLNSIHQSKVYDYEIIVCDPILNTEAVQIISSQTYQNDDIEIRTFIKN